MKKLKITVVQTADQGFRITTGGIFIKQEFVAETEESMIQKVTKLLTSVMWKKSETN